MDYFDETEKDSATWFGAMWLCQFFTGFGLLPMLKFIKENGGNWANVGFGMMIFSNASVYGVLVVMWFFSYVKKAKNQEVYYKGIKYTAPIGWAVVAINNILFIVEVIVNGTWETLVAPLAYDGLMFLFGIVGYYGLYPKAY